MASTTIKSTYSLDVETVRTLEAVARRWKVSKTEALRRAIRAAGEREGPEVADATSALDELQRHLNLNAEATKQWDNRLHAERKASSERLRR